MFTSGILDVAIGIIFVFALVGALCSAVREGLESWLKTRASYLEYAIRELLHDPDGSVGFARRFFEHPIIYALYRGQYHARSTQKPALWPPARNLPSYIPARSFAVAVLDLVARGPANADISKSEPLTLDSLRETVAKVKTVPEPVCRVLMSAIDAAQGDLNKVRASLEAWYDGAMDRVSGWYKRLTQAMIFVIALAVVALLNVNAITIADSLYRSGALRDATVQAAKDNTGAADYGATLRALDELRLPIGWSGGWGAPRNALEAGALRADHFDVWNDAMAPILGLLITALAATLGAPFWFDLLNKVMLLRATVKPEEKSRDLASEGRQPRPVLVPLTASGSNQAPVLQLAVGSAGEPLQASSPGRMPLRAEHTVAEDDCGTSPEHATPDESLPPATGGVGQWPIH